MIVYKSTNLINNQSYIGITTKTLEYRKTTHQKASKYSNKKFYNALKKYGFDNFKWSILYECDDIIELENMEIFYIKKYDTFNNGYNLTTGGELKKVISNESIEKMSEKRLDWLKNNKNPFKGKTHTTETKQKLSEIRKKWFKTNEHFRKGQELDETHKEMLSIAQKKWLENNEHPFKGKTQSIESKQKMKDMWKNRIELKCPHCGKIGKNNMNRYHFDNCKDKIGNLDNF